MAGGIRIPLYQLPQQQLRPVPEVYQQARTTAADFGGDLGRGLAQAGDVLGRIALARAAQDNEAAARDIDNQFAGALRTALYDPQRGYYASRGRAALDGRQPAQAGIEALRKTYAGLATNPDQQRMVTGVLDRRMQGALQGIADHALREGTAWRGETRRARIAGTVADGAEAWHDPTARQLAFNTGRGEVTAQAAESGSGPVPVTAALQDYDTRFHTAVVERQLAADPAAARTYLDQVRGTIPPAAATRLDTRVAEAAADRRAVVLAASYRPDPPADAGAPGPGPEPRQATYDAHALQDAGDDVAQRARNGTAMRARFRRDHAAWRERRSSGVQAAYDWVDANPDEPVLAMPPQVRDGMDASTQAKVSVYADQGGRVATDWRRYQALQRFAVSDPAAFADYDLSEDKWTLAAPQLDTLRKLQLRVRDGDPGHARTHLRYAMETVDDFLHEAGVTTEGAPAVALRQRFDEALAAFEHDKGRPAEPREMQAVFDGIALRGVSGGAAPSGPMIGDVPQDVRTTVRGTSTAAGLSPVSEFVSAASGSGAIDMRGQQPGDFAAIGGDGSGEDLQVSGGEGLFEPAHLVRSTDAGDRGTESAPSAIHRVQAGRKGLGTQPLMPRYDRVDATLLEPGGPGATTNFKGKLKYTLEEGQFLGGVTIVNEDRGIAGDVLRMLNPTALGRNRIDLEFAATIETAEGKTEKTFRITGQLKVGETLTIPWKAFGPMVGPGRIEIMVTNNAAYTTGVVVGAQRLTSPVPER